MLYIGGDMGQAFSGMIGGVIAGAFGYTALFTVAMLPLAASLIGLLLKNKN